MQTIESEKNLNLSILPANARQELIDFYYFLVEQYVPEKKQMTQPKTIAPRLVKEFKPLNRNTVYER